MGNGIDKGRSRRTAAGVVYAALSVYRMLCCYYVLQAENPGAFYLSYRVAVFSIFLYGAAAVWMLAAANTPQAARRGLAGGTVLAGAYLLITWPTQSRLVDTALQSLWPALAGGTAEYAGVLFQMVLLVLACALAPAGGAGPETGRRSLPSGTAVPEPAVPGTERPLPAAGETAPLAAAESPAGAAVKKGKKVFKKAAGAGPGGKNTAKDAAPPEESQKARTGGAL